MPFGCRAFALLVAVAMFAACGDDAPTQVDAPVLPDGVTIDAPDDCDPATIYFAGEVLAWDATSASPSGVAGVTVTQRDDMTKTGTTMMNGSFELCIANDP